MKRAGIQDKVAMEISGHKSRSIFDRYNIVDEGDIARARPKARRVLSEAQRGSGCEVEADQMTTTVNHYSANDSISC